MSIHDKKIKWNTHKMMTKLTLSFMVLSVLSSTYSSVALANSTFDTEDVLVSQSVTFSDSHANADTSQTSDNDDWFTVEEEAVLPPVVDDSTEPTDTSSENGTSSSGSQTEEPTTDSSSSSSSSSSGTGSSSGAVISVKPGESSSSSSDKTSDSSSTDKNGATISSSSSNKASAEAISPITYVRNQSTAEFIEEIGEDARAIGQKKDLYASVMIAQAILESASGNSSLSRTPNYNLFGIKGSYNGESVEMPTLEDDGKGGMYTIKAKFRKYPSYKESLNDYATLMSGGAGSQSTFYSGAWKSNTTSYKDATQFLTGRYATDTRYQEKLNGLIETYDLTTYDQEKPVKDIIEKSKLTEDFIKEIEKDVQNVAEENDLYASVLVADAVLKSISGNNVLTKDKNIFQVKGKYSGKSNTIETLIEKEDKVVLEPIEYKAYPNFKVATEDYVKTIKKDENRFSEMTKSKKNTYRKVTAYLTIENKQDRKYHKKLNSIIETYDLTRLDTPSKPEKKKKNTSKNKEKSLALLSQIGLNMSNKVTDSLDENVRYGQ